MFWILLNLPEFRTTQFTDVGLIPKTDQSRHNSLSGPKNALLLYTKHASQLCNKVYETLQKLFPKGEISIFWDMGNFRNLLSVIHLRASSYISLFMSSSSILACSPVTHLLSSVNCALPFRNLLFFDGVSSSTKIPQEIWKRGVCRRLCDKNKKHWFVERRLKS